VTLDLVSLSAELASVLAGLVFLISVLEAAVLLGRRLVRLVGFDRLFVFVGLFLLF